MQQVARWGDFVSLDVWICVSHNFLANKLINIFDVEHKVLFVRDYNRRSFDFFSRISNFRLGKTRLRQHTLRRI